MSENVKQLEKSHTENTEETPLSIIYVRKKIIRNLSTAHDMNNKRRKKSFKHNKLKIFTYANQQQKSYVNKDQRSFTNHKKTFSMPVLNYIQNEYKTVSNVKSWDDSFYSNTYPFKSNFLVYLISKTQYENLKRPYLDYNFSLKPCWKIYRCQLNTNEESCCCSCNSDAMFEVMKSLYDCYKKKNCDNCNCILCGHLPREERRLGELRKSGVSLALTKVEEKKRKKSKQKIKRRISSPLEGKNVKEKEQILKNLITSGKPLPEPKTKSDKELIKKVQTEYGYPQEVKTFTREDLRKTELPELTTPFDSKKIPADKLHKLKEAGLLTPLEAKSSEQKEKILTELAINGIPLPKGKSTSDKKLIDKIRKDVGLPPEPKTSSDQKKYDEAMALGFITPLLGKSASDKEKILKGQADLGLLLPEGRTASEKKIIAKIKTTKSELLGLKTPSTMLHKSKAEDILTPLKDKTSKEKENIIKEIAMKGIPLPEGKNASEKRLIDKVRAEVGLPPQPKTPSTKEKYTKAMAAGLIIPLEGKTDTQKKKILKEQAKLGVTLPEGRTPSEKNLIAKVKTEIKAPSEIVAPTERPKSAKAVGLITSLHGKTPEQKETILRDFAMHNVPLPEAKTSSEKRIIDKVRKDVGLPPEPKSKNEKSKYNQAIAAGLITPLEGKPQSQKEKILQGQADLGLQLPEGRSASEKSLIKKIKSIKKKSLKPHEKTLVEGILSPDKRKKLDVKTLKVLKEGKGPSDECICDLISPESEKIKKESKTLLPRKKPSEKPRATKTGDIQSPLQREKIIRELVKQGAHLPEAKTVSEKKILEKVQADLGLPPVPTTPSLKEKYTTAQKVGAIVPLEGKTQSQKEKILTKQAEMGITLPEGRSPSEKALINKIRSTVKPEIISSEKLRKAKEADLLTPLKGKSQEEKKRILRNIVKAGLPLPEGKTPSEKQIIKKVKDDIGLPSKGVASEILRKAKAAGLVTPLEDKTQAQKEKILRDRVAIGLPLPEGVTPSDKELIKKIKTSTGYTSPKISSVKHKKATGLLTTLEGKTPAQKEKIFEQQMAAGLPLPEGKSASEKEIIKKIQAKKSLKLSPLQGKTPSQKEKLLRNIAKQGLLLPEPKTLSEKALINKIQAETKVLPEMKPLSAKLRLAKSAGLLTPLEGKTLEQKEKILKGLTKAGIPLPEGKSSSEKKIIEKVREEVGLPPEPKTSLMKNKMKQAQLAGIITPLEGKSPTEKEKILKKMHEAGIPLPKGRTVSEKSLVKKIKADVLTKPHKAKIPSVKKKKAKAAGFLTPLEGKTFAQKEKIIRGLAKSSLPLPEGKTPSEKALINKIKAETGPTLSPDKIKKIDKKTAKVIKESKGPSDECICSLLTQMSDTLLELKKPSDKAYRAPSEKLRKTKTVDLLELSGKTPEQIEKSLKNLALQGIPLPEAKTTSEKKVINKIRADIGLPPEPRTPSLKEKYNKAMAAGFIAPLQGKSDAQKEKILRGQAQIGLPLPDGRTPSEKDLIAKIKATIPPAKVHISSEKVPKAKISDLRMSLDGKSPEQKDKILRNLAFQGIPFPEAKTSSEKKLMEKVRADVGLPPEPRTPSLKEKYNKAMAAGYIAPLQGKTDAQKEKILRGQAQIGLPLPDGRTPSEKNLITKIKATSPPLAKVYISSEKLPKAKMSDRRISLHGKSPEQKNKILRDLALQGMPFPEAKTLSEKKLMENVRADVGLPPEPKTPSLKEKYNKAMAAGFIAPLQGKTDAQKEKILRGQAQIGLHLPDGRTPSEKDLIAKIKATIPPAKVHISSEKVPKAKISDLRLSLHDKSPEQKNKILRNLAMQGIPFPEAKTLSEKKLMEKVRADVGLPPEPKTSSLKEKYNKAMAAGLITPLQGKSDAQKEKILRGQTQIGLSLPDGRTPSEKDLIAKIKATTPPLAKLHISSEKVPKAKISELRMSLDGKSPEQKDKILRNLALQGIPFPEAKTSSEKKLMEKVRADVGLPPEPKSRQEREKYESAVAAGIVTPLQGKSASQKEKILRGQAEMGLNLPKARTSSEKALIDKIRTTIPTIREPTEKIQKFQVPSLLTPLEGKTSKQKEKILKGLAMQGISLPEPKSGSEKKLIDKVRAEVGLPPEPKTASLKEKYAKAQAEGLISPLQGKTATQKEKILRGQAELGLPLPEGRTASEKALISKIKEIPPKRKPDLMPPKKVAKLDKKTAKLMKERKGPSDECICHILSPELEREPIVTSAIKALSKKSTEIYKIPSEKLRKAKDAGLLTPLQGKSSSQKEKILKGLAMQGIPLPEAKTVSEKKLIDKIRSEIGLPPEPKTKSARKIYNKAIADGYITPLQGKSEAQKEKNLRKQAELRLPLPEGRTPSEKKLIAKIKQSVPPPSEALLQPEIMAKAKAAGLLTPLEGKPFEKKEKILRNLAEAGLPLPEGKSPSEKSLIQKIKTEYGKQPKARLLPEKAVFKKSKAEGLLKISPEVSLLEKEGKIKKKSRKVGVASARRGSKHIGLFKSKGAITEEFQDVIKTTTCDRGCGCDKKKIRFKHSYVKIRVTSPDISSLCPCPEECVPGVKGGIFTDNEGIKVTVGRVIGAPSFSSKKSFNSDIDVNMYETYFKPSHITFSTTNFIFGEKSVATPYGCHLIKYYSHTSITNSKSETEVNIQKRYIINSSQNNSKNHSNSYNNIIESVTIKNMQLFKDSMSNSILSQEFVVTNTSNNTSFESINLLNKDLSVSLVTLPDSISVISFSTTETSPTSSFCEIKKNLHGYDIITNPSLSESQKSTNSLSTGESIRNIFFERNERYSDEISKIATHFENYTKHDVLVFGINKSKTCNLMELNNFNKTESNIFFNKLHNGFGIHQLLCPILSRRQMYDTSSLIIVICTSSDEHTSKYSLNSLSSTIGIDLLEKNCNWNYKANSLHHLHQNQRGFKLTTTGRTLKRNISAMLDNRPKITNMEYRKEIEETDFVLEKNNERKQQTLKTKANNCRIISTDTTQDRPCCCVVKEDKLHVSSDIYQDRIDNVVTELFTPIILKEADAQGLGQEPKVNSPRNNLICHPKLLISHSNLGIPSDRRSKACYCRSTQICDSRKISLIDIISSNILKTCDCDPKKLIELFDKRTKKMISKACNISKDELFVKNGTHKQIISEAPTSTNELCENCGSLDRDKKNLSRAIKLREKQLKHLCPCEQQKFSIENYIEHQVNDNKTTYSRYRCQCKDNKHYKKNICECPIDPEPEIDFSEWIDEKQMRKLKSDLTQTISGFKINKPRKKDENTEFEMSFEEVLKYIAENLEDENSKYNNEVCSCVGTVGLKSRNVSVDCECPYELSTPHTQTEQTFEEEPLKGIKFHISGKGSGSKGLNGILCFELLNNLSKQIKIQQQDNKIFI